MNKNVRECVESRLAQIHLLPFLDSFLNRKRLYIWYTEWLEFVCGGRNSMDTYIRFVTSRGLARLSVYRLSNVKRTA